MQSLLVQALTLRQLGRLTPRQLLTPGHGLHWTEWCPRTIHSRQVLGATHLLSHRTHKLLIRKFPELSWSVQHARFKSKKKGAPRATQKEDEEEDDYSVDSDNEDEPEDDPSLPKDYKDLEKFVQSFRYDLIMKAGLDIARNKLEDAFYSDKLRLNGQKLIKKSKLVKVGDTLDLILSENHEADTITLMRVILKKMLGESKDGDKYKVVLRRWKNIELSKQDAFKQ
ncbi:mitochondrial transcription rescue factor 1 [Osmerus mordax]|uniref:mitochondrial transcription rescue factor 1 n=1 Tax=Osmerus mordax TaxID=8014 RepID=UPI00350FBFBD